jgi:hypothetical protein
MVLHLKIIGCILIMLALVHFVFPKYFNWANDLSSLSLINRQLIKIHTFFIAFFVLLMGIFCICCSNEIIDTALGRKISFGLFIVWAVRLLFQFFIYSPRLWKGKYFETFIHIIFSLIWSYFSFVFYLIYINYT